MTVSAKTIALTEKVKVNEGSHILYFYQSEERYLENLSSFIITATILNQHAIVIETPARYKAVKQKLLEHITESEIENFVHYVNNYEFYRQYEDFRFNRVLENFKHTVQPFVDGDLCVRVWGLVDWQDQPNIMEKLHNI
ncbi:MEDS domain-containing protein [Alkalihalobacterium alkalinitrilicum]|uniref:MEDS domain-containing protein n=1 Tax=Alkalihalobacterium alkalinitrilicum TaxID=427920 RepID=UPI0009955C67|nr:MEDS domain-containing protein [Alkalihalobacterium alkalinitrilicum]